MAEKVEPADLRFAAVSLDCADLAGLATFYLGLLGGHLRWSHQRSVGVQTPGLLLIAQRVEGYAWPAWPGTPLVHLDLVADDLAAPVARALALGAQRAQVQPDPRWSVLLDPAGHPFCITTVAPVPR